MVVIPRRAGHPGNEDEPAARDLDRRNEERVDPGIVTVVMNDLEPIHALSVPPVRASAPRPGRERDDRLAVRDVAGIHDHLLPVLPLQDVRRVAELDPGALVDTPG